MSKFRDTRLYEALDYLDEAYVAEVVENLKVPPAPGMPTRKRGQLRYILTLAACLLVLSAAIPVITYVLRNYTEFPGWLVGETTADTSPELTEPETPPEVTTAPPAPETSENMANDTTAPLYDGTTALPEPEYDGSRGLLYKMNEDGKSYYLAGMGICTDEDIVVASTYDGLPVTAIGDNAFFGRTKIRTIVLPERVKSIGDEAFYRCFSLQSVTLPDKLESIGVTAFAGCKVLKGISIPESVKSIEAGAFRGCTILENVNLPSGLTEIANELFAGCVELKEIIIPEGVTSIGKDAFFECALLEEIILPEGVTFIGESAFKGCDNLRSVIIRTGMKKIGRLAFSQCRNLTSLTFNGTVAEWNAIEKEDGWNDESPSTVIHCSDGEVPLSMLTEEEAIEAARKFLNLPASAVLVAKDRSLSRLYCYKIAYCELNPLEVSYGDYVVKREVYVDQRTGECSEVVYDYPNIPEVFLDVIFNREKFLFVEQTTDSSGEYKYTTSEALFKDHSAHHDHVFGLQTLWYYVTDIDGDSIPELIFPGSARSHYGMLFRVYEGKIYGYACILDGLRTDATYLWHEQAGNYRGRSQVYFDGIFYKSRNLTEYDTNDPNNIIYYVEGKETTKEKYEEYESAFSDEELESFQFDYYPVYVNPYPGG